MFIDGCLVDLLEQRYEPRACLLKKTVVDGLTNFRYVIDLGKEFEVRNPQLPVFREGCNHPRPCRFKPFHRGCGLIVDCAQGVSELSIPFLDCLEKRRSKQRLFRAKVIADCSQTNPGSCCDVPRSRARVPLVQQTVLCPGEQRFAVSHEVMVTMTETFV